VAIETFHIHRPVPVSQVLPTWEEFVKQVGFKPGVKERERVMDEQSGESEQEEVMSEGIGESEIEELVPE